MAAAKLVEVEALRGFSSAHVGNREAGETFDYDVDGDPAKLIADGYVKPAKAKAGKAG